MSYYADPNNITSMVDLLNYTNNVTTLHDLGGNVIMTDALGIMILIGIWFMLFMSMNVGYSSSRSFAVANFICIFVSMALSLLGLLSADKVIIVVVLAFAGILLLFVEG